MISVNQRESLQGKDRSASVGPSSSTIGTGVARTENLVATLAAIGIAVLPIAEIVLRRFFSTGIEGAAPIASHLTLVVGMVGAAIAARDGKLLALATGTLIPEGPIRRAAQIVSALVGSLVRSERTGSGGSRRSKIAMAPHADRPT